VIEHDEILIFPEIVPEQARLNRIARYRQLRYELNLGVQAISDRLGIHRDSWHRYESEGGMPDSAILARIHELSGKDFLWLRGE